MVAAILSEAAARAPAAPRTVFIGGGTPSLLSPAQLARFFDGLERESGFRSSAIEVTVECNPESLDGEKAALLLELGATRLSIGFQSLKDDVLERLGRVHTAADSLRAFAAARAAGCRDLSVDLIFAAPGHATEDWPRDLATVLDLAPEHFSAYNLTFEEDTVFQRWLESGRIARQPEEDELELFRITREMALARGYEAYEISNFARPGRRCRHNEGYWQNGPYVGLGPSAVSHVGGRRSGNVRAIRAYLRRIAAGGGAADWSEKLGPRARLGETWWLGLRTADGVDPAAARAIAGFEGERDPALAVARELVGLGFLRAVEGRYRLSAAGLPVADAIASRFLNG